MQYRNDLCCKSKVAYDMEGAAVRWDSHSGNTMYVCEACGFIHYASNDVSRIDRKHERALAENARRDAHVALLASRVPNKNKTPKARFTRQERIQRLQEGFLLPPKFSAGTTCRVSVWKAFGSSIADILAAKEFERLERAIGN